MTICVKSYLNINLRQVFKHITLLLVHCPLVFQDDTADSQLMSVDVAEGSEGTDS